MSLNTQVGADIRALRKSRGVTLRELSQAVGRSVGWLSQVERSQTQPSINDLSHIASHFGLNISFFFRSANQHPEERGVVLRVAERGQLGSSETGLTEELLSPTLGGSFEMIKSVFAPHATSGTKKAAREIEHGGVVVSGRLSLFLDGIEIALETGDSFQFSDQSYSWTNPHDEPAVIIWVISPPVY